MTRPVHLVITDSGLGGLAICAGVERALRQHASRVRMRITYVNAWPDEAHGYNDLPDMAARASAFDRALARIDAMAPDLVLVACNTLSIVYPHTTHCRRASVAVQGIVEAGIAQFEEALREHATSALVLVGTRTTIDSGVHADALRHRGFAAQRVSGASCHGLATAIEVAPDGPDTDRLIEACGQRAAAVAKDGAPLFVGLCCTHYGFVGERLADAVTRHALRAAVPLDPNARLVRDVLERLATSPGRPDAPKVPPATSVEVVSKVTLPDAKRQNVASVIQHVSPLTARALREYAHVPDLF